MTNWINAKTGEPVTNPYDEPSDPGYNRVRHHILDLLRDPYVRESIASAFAEGVRETGAANLATGEWMVQPVPNIPEVLGQFAGAEKLAELYQFNPETGEVGP